MANDTIERKASFFRRWLKGGLKRDRSPHKTAVVEGRDDTGGTAKAEGDQTDPAIPKVWIEPKSQPAKRQTLLRKRHLTDSKLLIGRRGSIGDVPDEGVESYLISQHEPYTVSKRQCMLEIRDDGVWLCDLGSRYGTLIDGRKIGGRRKDAVMEMKLERGEYLLTPGPKGSRFVFKISVK